MVPFGRTTLESKRHCIPGPITAPVEDVVIRKVVPCCLAHDWHRFDTRVIPGERPEIVRIDLVKASEPVGHASGFSILKTLRQAIQSLLDSMNTAAGRCAVILFSLALTRE